MESEKSEVLITRVESSLQPNEGYPFEMFIALFQEQKLWMGHIHSQIQILHSLMIPQVWSKEVFGLRLQSQKPTVAAR